MAESFEVVAVRQGTQLTRHHDLLYRAATYGEDDREQRLDFFFWVVRNDSRVVLFDTGLRRGSVEQRPGRHMLHTVAEALAALGLQPEDVTDVVLSHLHWDHVGGLGDLGRATIHVQRAELDFWASAPAARPPQRSLVDDRAQGLLDDAADQGRLVVSDGDGLVCSGIGFRRVGGHTPGQQVLRVEGHRPVLLASDALHLYEEMDLDRPCAIFSDLAQVYDALGLLRQAARSGTVVVAGHDPSVMERFTVTAEIDGAPLAVRVQP